jgi:hypothetical protein
LGQPRLTKPTFGASCAVIVATGACRALAG